MEEILIVDGYNIIGATQNIHELKHDDLEGLRDQLIDQLADYQAFKGVKVYVIFDAHNVVGQGSAFTYKHMEIIYTRQNQTADEYIEKMIKKLLRVQRQVYVATSDYMEQRVIFGEGALRKSARELLSELAEMQSNIRLDVEEKYQKKAKEVVTLSDDIAEIFEKWRRS